MAKKKVKKPINPNMLMEHFLGGVIVRSFRPVLLDNFKTKTLPEQEDDEEGDTKSKKPRAGKLGNVPLQKSILSGRNMTENNENTIFLQFSTNVLFNVEDIQLIYQSRQDSIDAKKERLISKDKKRASLAGGKKFPWAGGDDAIATSTSDDEVEKSIVAKMQSKGTASTEKSSIEPDPDWYVDDLSSLKKQMIMPQNRDVNKKLQTLQTTGRLTPGYFVGIGGSENGIIVNSYRTKSILIELFKSINEGKIDSPIAAEVEIQVQLEADDEYELNDELYRKISIEYGKALESILLFDRSAFSYAKEIPQNALELPPIQLWGARTGTTKASLKPSNNPKKSTGSASDYSFGTEGGGDPV